MSVHIHSYTCVVMKLGYNINGVCEPAEFSVKCKPSVIYNALESTSTGVILGAVINYWAAQAPLVLLDYLIGFC